MNKEPLVSIIVPCYNNGKYLKGCIDSLVAQSYRNIEIIIVDDGSTDNTESILEEYKRKDKRIQSVSQQNGGPPCARNSGLSVASGEYITFVDADDALTENAVEIMLSHMDDNTDWVVCSYIEKWLYDKPIIYSDRRIHREDLAEMFLRYASGIIFLWKNLYRKSIFDTYHLQFDKTMQFAEDYCFNINYLNCIQRDLVIVSEPVCHYYTYRSSQHRRYFPDIYLYYTRVLDAAFACFKDKAFTSEIKRYFAGFYLHTLIDYYTFNTDRKNAERMIGKAYQEVTRYFDADIIRELLTDNQYRAISSEHAEGFLKAYYGNRLNYLKFRAFGRKSLLTLKRKLIL